MSLENCFVRVAMATLVTGSLFTAKASANFDTNDPRVPTPAHVSSSPAVFQTPGGTFHIDSFFDIFTELQRVPPPQLGVPPQIDSFFDVFTELSMSVDQQPPSVFQLPMQCAISTACLSDDGTTRFFDTEMLSLDLSSGAFRIRESPTRPSRGQTTITDIGGGMFHIDSFFDVFTELSLDGGQTWMPSTGSMRLTGVPEPTTLGVLAGAAMILIRRRHN